MRRQILPILLSTSTLSAGGPALLVAETGAPRASTGCGVPFAQPTGESVERTLGPGPLLRRYRLRLPDRYDPSVPAPLVLVFHGYTGTAQGVEDELSWFRRRGDDRGVVVVYPQATGFLSEGRTITSWNDVACHASPGPEGSTCTETADDYPTPPECGAPQECDWCTCHDDVAFIVSLLDDLEKGLCLDLDRVFATGISNGAMFVHRLGCDLPERFAAIAPVAGTLARGAGCAPTGSNRVSIMNVYGTADTLVPADGSPGRDGFLYEPSTKVMTAWAASQGCRPEETPYTTAFDGVQGVRCVERAGCVTAAEVVDCAWDGGHDWPRAGDDELATGLIWDFFEKNAR